MSNRIRRASALPAREITPESVYLRRRDFLATSALALGGLVLPGCSGRADEAGTGAGGFEATTTQAALTDVVQSPQTGEAPYSTAEEPTPYEDATSYNNFYEFGTGKRDPARYAFQLQTKPWSVAVEGEVAKPGSVPLETLLGPHSPEERIYRLRCVEAWSMVIPWVGIPLGDVLRRFDPTSRARYVAFETLHDPEQMPGQKSRVLEWPYREGLRMDEALHPLTLLAVGMYGRELPNQNGAPLRLVVPWKYGFKSIKSIVRIRLQERQPPTSWNLSAPSEYGFFSNVNPDVDHPRWSQARERRIGEFRKRETLPFNGYAEHVASLYDGMDLRRFF